MCISIIQNLDPINFINMHVCTLNINKLLRLKGMTPPPLPLLGLLSEPKSGGGKRGRKVMKKFLIISKLSFLAL